MQWGRIVGLLGYMNPVKGYNRPNDWERARERTRVDNHRPLIIITELQDNLIMFAKNFLMKFCNTKELFGEAGDRDGMIFVYMYFLSKKIC